MPTRLICLPSVAAFFMSMTMILSPALLIKSRDAMFKIIPAGLLSSVSKMTGWAVSHVVASKRPEIRKRLTSGFAAAISTTMSIAISL